PLIELRRRIIGAWKALQARPGLLVSAIAVSFAANLLIGGTLACGLAAIHPTSVPWASLLWTLPVIGLAASMPFSVAGAGARESAAIALWSAYGISAPHAVAACLLTLTATLIGALPGGLLFLHAKTREPDPAPGRTG
ncbi:MAG TPA: lysylphosphatidylglycerol synthase domain-containing protein, partial [Verrucomicrobiota bacterium]|nr:lysylphosphatidylglycerol synthase domain-containing protein [Verrucomicrobiota bacterium]